LGELHEAKPPPSREHSKVESGSEEEKAKLAELLFTVLDGPESMVVSGGVVSAGGGGGDSSTLKVLEAGVASTLPASSLALTSKV